MTKYFSLLSEKKYEKMYELLSPDSQKRTKKEKFISRNQNIYEGIEATNIKVTLSKDRKSSYRDTEVVTYHTSMDTLAGRIEFENFSVEVKRSVYNNATRCGKLELQIKNRKNNKEKLFVTGADIVSVNKEGNEVVELDHGYQVEFGGALAKWYAEETDYWKEGQSVALYYVNTGEKETKDLMKLQIVETVSRKVETEWEIPVKTDDETVTFTGSKIARNIVLSKYGFMEKNELEEGEPSLKGYNLIVYYKDGSKQTIMKTVEDYSSPYSVFLPKTAYASEEEKSAYFNCDFTDLKEIEMLKLGGAYYYPKGTQKAEETAMDDIYEKENALFRMETSLDRLETVSGRIAYMPLEKQKYIHYSIRLIL